jgi:hypothetical protein
MNRKIIAILHALPDEKVKFLLVGAYALSLSVGIKQIEIHIFSYAD